MKIKSKYLDHDCLLLVRPYPNSRPAIQLIDAETHELLCIATINLPEVELPKDCVLIKTWSENEGIMEALIANQVIEDTGERIPAGYAEAAVCRYIRR